MNFSEQEMHVVLQALPEGGYVPPLHDLKVVAGLIERSMLTDIGHGRVEATGAGVFAFYEDADDYHLLLLRRRARAS